MSNIMMTEPQMAFPNLCGLLAKSPTRLSQAMHNAGFRAKGLEFFYVNFDTEDTESALSCMRKLGIRGFSLTIPHKEKAMDLVDSLSEEARAVGAINTVINNGNELKGYNTDCFGIERGFSEAGVSVKGGSVLVLGAGGASRAGLKVLEELGAKEVKLANRSVERAEELAKDFSAQVIPLSALSRADVQAFDIIINSTPLGSKLFPQESPIDPTWVCSGQVVFDFVTNETALTKATKKVGAVAIVGERMLLHQGVEQFRLFTGEQAPQDVMEQALREELGIERSPAVRR